MTGPWAEIMPRPRKGKNVRVLVTGGRHRIDPKALQDAIRALDGRPTVIIHGAAPGMDALAGAYAHVHDLDCESYPKNPGETGFERNVRMYRESKPDIVLAFPGRPRSAGTWHMVQTAVRMGTPVRVYP